LEKLGEKKEKSDGFFIFLKRKGYGHDVKKEKSKLLFSR
jgi:hypothetical protein